MATLSQLLKLHDQILSDEQKLKDKKEKRHQLIEDLKLKKGDYLREQKAENFVTINEKPQRLWVYASGHIVVEELSF
jgi:hypothetical protein